MQRTYVSFDGTKIHYDIHEVKTQQPSTLHARRTAQQNQSFLVFIHGAGGDLNAWNRERHAFHNRGIATLAIDLRGHGLSDRPHTFDAYQLTSFAQDIAGVLHQERLKNVVLVGHCFGGMVAITFYSLYPRLAKAYVLIDTTYKAPQYLKKIFTSYPFLRNLRHAILQHKFLRKTQLSHVDFSKFKGTGDFNLLRIYSDITHTSLRSWLFTYEAIAHFDGTAILRRMKRPVLIIVGEKDLIFPVLVARKIRMLVKQSTLNVIPNANHIIVLNNPEIVEKEIVTFIKSLPPTKQKPSPYNKRG
ncbi:alpha/beta hydrolase [Candidatus Woesearchaeota archaeon]|nr:alpha/beta hydrolase [Candidatus Woesearchaeota archaeon]